MFIGVTVTEIVSDFALILFCPSLCLDFRIQRLQTEMYIRSNSEPPDQSEDQLKNGLRGGFPIKINGYALGSQENLQHLGREGSSDRMDIFGPRVRSRQNSVSIQSSVIRNLERGFFLSYMAGGPIFHGIANRQPLAEEN